VLFSEAVNSTTVKQSSLWRIREPGDLKLCHWVLGSRRFQTMQWSREVEKSKPSDAVSYPRRHTSFLRWVRSCNVTMYRNTVSWQCERDSWLRTLSKVSYAVMLRASSVRCRYLAVESKGWYGYDQSRSERATWHVTTFCSYRLLYIHEASGSRNKLGTPWCNARRILLRHEALSVPT
jgi:hypothetical protein